MDAANVLTITLRAGVLRELNLKERVMTMVIAVFEAAGQAQEAQARLHAAQFAPGQVHLASGHVNFAGEIVADPKPNQDEQRRSGGVLASLGSFWVNLVESHAHSEVLDSALQRGHVILVAQVQSAEQSEQASDILLTSGALVVEHGVQRDPTAMA